jgi:hypothetical protein
MLSEKTLKAITKLYDKVDFKETAIALDPNHEASIFAKGKDGKATEGHARSVCRNIETYK